MIKNYTKVKALIFKDKKYPLSSLKLYNKSFNKLNVKKVPLKPKSTIQILKITFKSLKTT